MQKTITTLKVDDHGVTRVVLDKKAEFLDVGLDQNGSPVVTLEQPAKPGKTGNYEIHAYFAGDQFDDKGLEYLGRARGPNRASYFYWK